MLIDLAKPIVDSGIVGALGDQLIGAAARSYRDDAYKTETGFLSEEDYRSLVVNNRNSWGFQRVELPTPCGMVRFAPMQGLAPNTALLLRDDAVRVLAYGSPCAEPMFRIHNYEIHCTFFCYWALAPSRNGGPRKFEVSP